MKFCNLFEPIVRLQPGMEGEVRQIVLSNTDEKYCFQALEKDKTLWISV